MESASKGSGMSRATCQCPDGTRSYYDQVGERCRECGRYRPGVPDIEDKILVNIAVAMGSDR